MRGKKPSSQWYALDRIYMAIKEGKPLDDECFFTLNDLADRGLFDWQTGRPTAAGEAYWVKNGGRVRG